MILTLLVRIGVRSLSLYGLGYFIDLIFHTGLLLAIVVGTLADRELRRVVEGVE